LLYSKNWNNRRELRTLIHPWQNRKLFSRFLNSKNASQKSGGIFEVDRKKSRLQELETASAVPEFWGNPQQAQTTLKELTRLKEDLKIFSDLEVPLRDLRELAALAEESDNAMMAEIQKHLTEMLDSFKKVERQAKFSDPNDRADALLTIHAGAGGTEACDWAEMLTRMYERYSERKGYSVEIIDILAGDQAGIKSITFFVRGPYAYGNLRGEVGVHRLVRISPFDANKRRHTSFASCDVLPEIEEDIEIEIQEKDLRIDTYRSHGAGGQHINKTDSAVRITHLPTGIVVACQNQRSQIKNREKAFKILRIRLYELEQEKQRKAMEKRYDEKGDIAWGNQIRSYVFMPYQMVKDHRTGFEISQVSRVMDGDLDELIDQSLEYSALKKTNV
jgi:peptide chain release factor 2